MITGLVKDFFKMEASSSIILVLMMLLALIAANSPLTPYYDMLHTPHITLTINDGLMAFFFLMIGMEIRHEMHDGELANPMQVRLPLVAALGGILVPAVIYMLFNWGTPAEAGWAIPTATDIAFSLGIISFFGRSVSPSLRMFLMMVAIIDDIAAVCIIAAFYSESVSATALALAGFCVVLLFSYNRTVTRIWPYIFAGAALWVAMLDSGVHASLAGVIIGLLLPLNMSKAFLPKLHPWVAYGVMPIFAFANAGVPLSGLTLTHLASALPLGIAVGLFAGKQAGIFLAAAGMIKFRYAALPSCSWLQFYGVCVLAGIGFTMSLFIGSLAFTSEDMMRSTRIGVLVGSLASALIGAIILKVAGSRSKGIV